MGNRPVKRLVIAAVGLVVVVVGLSVGIPRLVQELFGEESPVHVFTGATEVHFAAGGDQSILVHCGNSMRPPLEELARAFQKEHAIGIKFNFGGSSQLLPAIELAHQGDLYICHDPYADILDEKGLLAFYEVVGYLEPVLITARGNPLRIQSLADLVRENLRVGLTDARYTTAGQLVQEAIAIRGWAEEITKNVRMESRDHNTLALAIMANQLDVAVAWNFVTHLYAGNVERIETGEDFPETRVTVCFLEHAENPEAAQIFADFLLSDYGQEVFARHGYTKGAN